MDIALPFITQRKKSKKGKPSNTRIINIHNEHTPVEIMNMDMPELEYLYMHGSPSEKELADNIIRARKKWIIASSLSDDIVPTGSPTPGAPSAYVVGQRGD